MPLFEQHRERFCVSTDPHRMDIPAIHAYLVRSYWAEGIPESVVAKSIEKSLCFGLFDGDRQIGLARVITDRATYAYLCDVYVLEEYRGQGLGKWLMQSVMAHPELQHIRRFMLATRDAQGLYEKFGFTVVQHPEKHMEIVRPGIYKEQ